MKREDFLCKTQEKTVSTEKVSAIQNTYNAARLPEFVQKIISECDRTIFFDDGGRLLAFDEIISAERDLHVDFKHETIIPLMDMGENDFIVYNFNDNIWAEFNITDEISFNENESLSALMEKIC